MSAFLFEHHYRNRLWRLQPLVHKGEPRLNFWAWFPHSEGWRACKGNEVGFVLSVDAAAELRDALSDYLDSAAAAASQAA